MINYKIIEVKPLEDYKLLLNFENVGKKIFDVKPYITGSWYGQLKDYDFFKTVRITDYGIEWSDGQDIAPHELYENSKSV